MSVEIKTFCWSCGKSPENCTCGQEGVIIEVKPPEELLPFCGKRVAENTKYSDVVPRPCCRCGQSWMCDEKTWIHGQCPHCRASGAFVKKLSVHKPDGQNELIFSIEKIDKIKILKSLETGYLQYLP